MEPVHRNREKAYSRAMEHQTVRVLVANQPRLMRELILATIADQPDIEVVGEIADVGQLEAAVDSAHPDFVIVTLEESDQLPPYCRGILDRAPRTKIIAISPERNSTIFYWAALEVRSNPIEASEEGLLTALRTGVSTGRN